MGSSGSRPGPGGTSSGRGGGVGLAGGVTGLGSGSFGSGISSASCFLVPGSCQRKRALRVPRHRPSKENHLIQELEHLSAGRAGGSIADGRPRGGLAMRSMVAVLLLAFAWSSTPSLWAIKQTPRETEQHPEVVLVTAKDSRPHRTCVSCGVLLAPTVVLTVAHGVAGFESWQVKAPYASPEANKASVKLLHVNPAYKAGNAEADLAILLLDRPLRIKGEWPSLPAAELYPLETRVTIVGRVADGKISMDHLYAASAILVEVRGDTNVYGGHPNLCELGDSGGPVFLARHQQQHQLVGLMCGSLGFSRANVATDVYVPLGGRNRDWIANQLPRPQDAAKP